MSWFFRKNSVVVPVPDPQDPKIEIIANQRATAQSIEDVQIVNKHLNKLFEDNHFTLKIYLAAGGYEQRNDKSKKEKDKE